MSNCKAKFSYRQLNTKDLLVNTKYQRTVDMNRVKRIVAQFNPNLVNPIKVSYRDGKYYVFDGQHTMAAMKLRNLNRDLMVECKVYEGLTDVEEAKLFSEQNGISRAIESRSKYKALFFAGDVDVVEMVKLTESTGLNCDFEKGQSDNRVVAVAKLYKVYKGLSAGEFVDLLKILKEIWNGDKESLNTEIIGGLYLFYTKYKGRFKRNTLISQLQKTTPKVIIREGKAYSSGGDLRFAREILKAYNKGLRNKLPEDL